MPINPFNSNEGSSLEQGNPITQVTKPVASAVSGQVKKTNQSFVDQLYGNVSPQSESGDQPGDAAQALAQGQKPSPAATQALSTVGASPGDEAQLTEARRKLQELQRQHTEKYVEPTFGEAAQKKRRQQEMQAQQIKEQEEQEDQERKAQEKAQQEEEMRAMQPQGKGRNRMSQPISVTQAKTKTEINRGASG